MRAPLEVRGQQRLARPVPVYQDERIIGAVGLALFSNMASLKKAVAVASGENRAIHSPPTPWAVHHGLDDILGTGRAWTRCAPRSSRWPRCRCRCWCRARPAAARSWRPTRSTRCRRARARPSCGSTAPPSRSR